MRKLLISLFAFALTVAPAFADSVADLKAQVDALQTQLSELSKQLEADRKATLEKNKELLEQLKGVKSDAREGMVHATKDRLQLGVELRTQFNSINYSSVYGLPAYANDMMGMWLNDTLVSDFANKDQWDNEGNADGRPGDDGFNDSWMASYGSDFNAVVQKSMTDAQFSKAFEKLSNSYGAGSETNYSDYRTQLIEWYDNLYYANANTVTSYAQLIGALDMVANGGNGNGVIDTATEIGNLLNVHLGYMFSDQTLNDQQLVLFKRMFTVGVKPRKYDTGDSSIWTNRLRIRLSSAISDKVRFTGRLVTYKAWGDTSKVKWMDGTFQSMYMDGNSGAVPSDDAVRVERAYFVYSEPEATIPWHVSLGRRPSTSGLGVEEKENAPLGGSPLAHIIQWNFDGGSIAFDFENLTDIPGLNVKFCYGKGYESQNGSINAMAANNGLLAIPQQEDVEFYGLIVRALDDGQYKVFYNYAIGVGITDGFTGEVAMPFIVTGLDTDMDGAYEQYSFSPNTGAYQSKTEAMTEMGDLEMHSFFVGGTNFDWRWFASYSMSRILPNGNQSRNAMYQVMDADYMMGSKTEKTGNSIWVGIATPKFDALNGAYAGFEYNQGSKYWMNMTGGDGEIAGSKLAVRGKVYELYYHQPIVGDRFFLTLGAQLYDYEYTGSGNFMGAPQKIGEELDGLHAMMPVVDTMEKYYFNATYRF